MKHTNAILSAALLVSAGLAAHVHSVDVQAKATPSRVDMKNAHGSAPYVYTPKTITVRVGAKVTFRNVSSAPHTVSDTGKHHGFDSGMQHLINPGHSWSYVFHHPGTYSYKCLLHPYMLGKVIVKH